uniref:Uncharacterized protein n=1 Tax=Panagrolaimus sp. JU765 TaxID=591449 RepID=A0AC34QCV8_9BILA
MDENRQNPRKHFLECFDDVSSKDPPENPREFFSSDPSPSAPIFAYEEGSVLGPSVDSFNFTEKPHLRLSAVAKSLLGTMDFSGVPESVSNLLRQCQPPNHVDIWEQQERMFTENVLEIYRNGRSLLEQTYRNELERLRIENKQLIQNLGQITEDRRREVEELKEKLQAMESTARCQQEENEILEKKLKSIEAEYKDLKENFNTKLENEVRDEVTLVEKAYEEEMEKMRAEKK